jgi:hypothetical protein
MTDKQKQALQLLRDNLSKMSSKQVDSLMKLECLVPDMNSTPPNVMVPDTITEKNARIIINWLKDGCEWKSMPKFETIKVQICYHIDGVVEVEANDFGGAEELFRNLSDEEKINGLFLEEPLINEMKECRK